MQFLDAFEVGFRFAEASVIEMLESGCGETRGLFIGKR